MISRPRHWVLNPRILSVLAVMLAVSWHASIFPLQAGEAPHTVAGPTQGAPPLQSSNIACSTNPEQPKSGDTFTLKFDVSNYSGEHSVFAKYKIMKGTSEVKDGESKNEYTNDGVVTLNVQVSLEDAGEYSLSCQLWEDGPVNVWTLSDGNKSIGSWKTTTFSVVPKGEVACDTVPANPTAGQAFNFRFKVSNYSGSNKVFVKYRERNNPFDLLGTDTQKVSTNSSGEATIPRQVTYSQSRNYVYECRLKEDRGGQSDSELTDWQTFSFTVNPDTSPPTITSLGCSNSTVSLGETVTCQPSFTGGSPTSYTWQVGGGFTRNSRDRNLSVYWTSTGTKTVSLTASNSGVDSVPKTYQISIENDEPSVSRISISPSPVTGNLLRSGTNYIFRATGTDDDGNLSGCQWYVGSTRQSSSQCNRFGSNTGSKTATMTFHKDSPGSYTVRVVFTDSDGESDEVSRRVTVNSAPEITLLEPTSRSLSIYDGQEFEFRVRAEDADGNLAKWKVDKAGSIFTTNIEPERTITNVGQFTPTFGHTFELPAANRAVGSTASWDVKPIFTDSLGESVSDSWKVTVMPASDLVLKSIDGPIRSVYNDEVINFGVILENKGGSATRWFNVSARVRNFSSGRETTFEHAGSDPGILARGIEHSIPAGQTHGTSFTSPDLDGIDSGDYRLCAVAKQVGVDAYDFNENNNEVCKDLYILPGSTGAMPVHLGLTITNNGRRHWSAVPADIGPDGVREAANAGDFKNEDSLKKLYKRLVVELAFRTALESDNEESHVWFEGLGNVRDAAELAGKIYEFCEAVDTPCKAAIENTGLHDSGLLGKLPPNALDVLEDGADFAILFGDAYFSMLVNQALDAQRAHDTLDELSSLPLGPVWRQAIREARVEVGELTSSNNLIAIAASIEANKEDFIKFAALKTVKGLTAKAIKKHLLQKSLIFSQKAIAHAFGLKVAGGAALSGGAAGTAVATGSLALFVASLWFANEVYLDVRESRERVGVGSLASFLNAAYYNPSDTGDLREALAYAEYAAYDNFYESDDTWLQGLAAIITFTVDQTEEFKEVMALERDKALEELRELLSVHSVEVTPATLALTVGQAEKLDLDAKTGSGKSASTQGFEWTSSAPAIATASADGTVTGVAPGATTITLRSGGITATADVVVTAAPLGDTCTNGVVVPNPQSNRGLVGDCRVLLLLRDGWRGGATSLNWGASVPIGDWQGLSLNSGKNRVVALALPGQGLTGAISPDVGRLTALGTLDLSGNNLTGNIPGELGSVGSLEILDLANNSLGGDIPAALAQLSLLRILKLSDNQLIGCVPAALESVSNNDFPRLARPFCDTESDGNDDIDPQNGDRVYLTGGTLNDQPIASASPSLTVQPGQRITGTVDLTVHNDQSPGARFPVVATPTWGDHERSYWQVRISAPAFGSASGSARVNLTAPDIPGEYAIIFVAQAEASGGYVASATHGPSGAPRWNNGDDVANWDDSTIDFAIENGYVLARQHGSSSPNAHFGAAAIKVVVTAAETVEPGSPERDVLVALYNATDGPNWRAQQGWMSSDPIGSWRGVVTDGSGNVTQLLLDGYGLNGPLPPELGNLSNLERLNLQRNQLTDDIPPELGKLTQLTLLRLSGNRLTGCVPAALEDVSTNDFEGLELPFCDEESIGIGVPPPPPPLTGPQGGDRVYLNGGTLNGERISSAGPTLTVAAGQTITGTVDLMVHNDHFAGARFPVVATATWGDHERSYWRVPVSVPAFGSGGGAAPVNLTAPDSPGEYAIIFVAQAETSGGHVASATHWPSGSPRWDNGDDVAGWDDATIAFAIENGYVLAPQHGWSQANAHFGAAAVRIVVTAKEEEEEEEEEDVQEGANCLEDIICFTSSPVAPAAADAAIRREFGADWVVADWNDVKELWSQHQEELKTFFRFHTRLKVDGAEQWGSSGRLYFIQDNDGSKPGYFLAHDELGGHELSLGSWFGEEWTTLAIQSTQQETSEPTPDPTGPQNGDRVYMNGGTLNGQLIGPANPTLTVEAGQAISGTVTLTVYKDHFAGAVFPVEATPTWGDHGRGYWRVPLRVPAFGNARGDALINVTAPDTPGEYAIIFVAQAELSGGYVASGTHWPSGGPRWNNGDDVASWDDATIDFAIGNGYVLAPQYGSDPAKAHFGAAAIKVTVTAAVEDDVEDNGEASNCLQDILCYTSDSVEHSEAAASIRQEFGEDWVVADWNDLKSLWSLHQAELKEFFPFGARVNVDGNAQWGSSGRWYFVEDHGGSKPANFLAHDELGGHELSLGSWFFDEAHYLAIESSEEEEETDEEEGPDLVVESLSVDENSVDPEERFTLSATVRNQGDEESDATTLRYYRSTDSTISTTDTQLDTDDVRSLRPERTGDESLRMEAPADAGTYYFGACVDSVTDESNTQNNCSDGVAVTVLGVDLVVQSASASESRVELNDSFELSATVRNQGEGESDSSTLRYYRSTDSTIDTGDAELTTDTVSSLDPGESDYESETVYAPVTAGTYYYGACVDSVTGESDTQNNCSTGVEITAVEGDPELSVSLTRLSDNILGTGVSFTLAATVRNYGEGDAASTTLRYYRSTDSFISTSDTQVGGTDTVGGLAVEETEDHSESMTTPDSSGTYYYGACVETVPGESFAANDCSVGMAIGVGQCHSRPRGVFSVGL